MLDTAPKTGPRKLVEVAGLKMYFPITAGIFRTRVGDVKGTSALR